MNLNKSLIFYNYTTSNNMFFYKSLLLYSILYLNHTSPYTSEFYSSVIQS